MVEIYVHGCKFTFLKNLKTVVFNYFLYKLIEKHVVICNKKPELQAYA